MIGVSLSKPHTSTSEKRGVIVHAQKLQQKLGKLTHAPRVQRCQFAVHPYMAHVIIRATISRRHRLQHHGVIVYATISE